MGERNSAPPKPSKATAVVYFDLSEPLEPQLESMKRLLMYEQDRLERLGHAVVRTAPKNRPIPELLRILDAFEHGVTSEAEIARVLYPKDSGDPVEKVRQQHKQAKALRDGGWRKLMLVSHRNASKKNRA